MTRYNALRALPAPAGFGPNDVLFLCGELFGRGYANGIVDKARAHGMTVIGTTVGRRDTDGSLRPLTAEELATAEELLGGRIINVPLEAGFDLEPGTDGLSPVDRLKGVKPDDWAAVRLDRGEIEHSRQAGSARFRENLGQVVRELEGMIPASARVLCVHTMAGGIPRARIFMPLLNKIFKGQGERFVSSEAFWNSDLGQLCAVSFNEVTADTFGYLLEATLPLRERFAVSYAAYGYHGCEVLINGAYTWQSYTPYLQGWAKIRLEEVAQAAWEKGIKATVYNCPEIQTNSSALFLGVENSLYPLISSLDRAGEKTIAAECAALLKQGETLEALLEKANDYLASLLVTATRDLAGWPQHNLREQQDFMLNCSAELLAMNENQKDIVCAVLSRAVFQGVGQLMFDASWEPAAPVFWLNHDVIAQALARAD